MIINQNNQHGFLYIWIILSISISSIGILSAQKYWSTIVKRENETQLLYAGDRIRKAIKSYYETPPIGFKKKFPKKLDDLLRDPRYNSIKRHLRKIYIDPVSKNYNWGIIKSSNNGISGIYSKNLQIPLKKANFPEDYTDFENAKNYSDWKFIYVVKKSKSKSKSK